MDFSISFLLRAQRSQIRNWLSSGAWLKNPSVRSVEIIRFHQSFQRKPPIMAAPIKSFPVAKRKSTKKLVDTSARTAANTLRMPRAICTKNLKWTIGTSDSANSALREATTEKGSTTWNRSNYSANNQLDASAASGRPSKMREYAASTKYQAPWKLNPASRRLGLRTLSKLSTCSQKLSTKLCGIWKSCSARVKICSNPRQNLRTCCWERYWRRSRAFARRASSSHIFSVNCSPSHFHKSLREGTWRQD